MVFPERTEPSQMLTRAVDSLMDRSCRADIGTVVWVISTPMSLCVTGLGYPPVTTWHFRYCVLSIPRARPKSASIDFASDDESPSTASSFNAFVKYMLIAAA